jgi:gamma-glutamylcyclotransferase (GGCT)/AIG2-like uncharacterized protein YtfP
MPSQPSHLFVYGTLMSDGTNAYAMLLRRQTRFAGKAAVEGVLYRIGPFPGLVLGGGASVHGELYRLPPSHEGLLRVLDQYEGCGLDSPQPHMFRKAVVRPKLATGRQLDALTYVYALTTEGKPRIPSGRFREAFRTCERAVTRATPPRLSLYRRQG